MDCKEIILALMEQARDMDFADYDDEWDTEVELLTDDLEDLKAKDSCLYHLLERLAEM